MRELFRFRNLITVGGTLIVMFYIWFSDPNGGDLTIPFIAKLATPIVAVFFAHWARKALFDYLNMGEIYQKAMNTATGAGLVFLGVCIVIFGLLGLFGSQVYAKDVRTYIPDQAAVYFPVLIQEQTQLWPNHPKHLPLPV